MFSMLNFEPTGCVKHHNNNNNNNNKTTKHLLCVESKASIAATIISSLGIVTNHLTIIHSQFAFIDIHTIVVTRQFVSGIALALVRPIDVDADLLTLVVLLISAFVNVIARRTIGGIEVVPRIARTFSSRIEVVARVVAPAVVVGANLGGTT